MTKPTGNRPGRPLGAKNRRTAAVEAAAKAAAEVIEAAMPGAFEGDAHAFLMAVYKDPKQPLDLRVDAAKSAIRYEKPALSTVDVTSLNEHVVHTVSDQPLSAEEWQARHGLPDKKPN